MVHEGRLVKGSNWKPRGRLVFDIRQEQVTVVLCHLNSLFPESNFLLHRLWLMWSIGEKTEGPGSQWENLGKWWKG